MADEYVDLNAYNGAPLVAICVVFLSLTWLAVGLRIYTRAMVIRSLQEDDWLMLVAQLIFTLSCIFIFNGIHSGMGKHNAAITDGDEQATALMWQALAAASYILNMMFIKMSIGIFLLRVSARKVYNWIICISLGVVIVWSLVTFFYDIFQCSPIQKQWDFRIESGKCVSTSDLVSAAYAISVMTILSDWLYALLPIPMLWSVKMTPQAKATVIIILGLGIFASVATLIRIRYLTVMKDLDDLLFAATQVMTWTVIEPGVAIIAASLATIRPLLRAWRVHGFASTFRSRSRTAHSTPSAYARQTTENRSTPVIDHIFGPDDVSLKSVQPSYETVPPETSMKNIGLTIEQAQASTATVSLLDVEQARSHASQGQGRAPSRSVITEASHKTNSSLFDDLNGLEAQSQEGGY
ncbi:uncharacterized protein TrAtP1_011128 [Trichoderma atroviride]|uniref:Rhodopsin domain-containing protein n=1 Tax=Hypocrea atroviridis (strain ATCC 20476 / IMI 206040) TaxID=452589 RepID=G9NF91_HYPAI|nr:uncharacterized protein TRIATDRAFT_314211 [Trichoderma atroviride IMI 206040]EHK50607.1 hypothetical protein TRIATDRAFT_314211 [Trichoderma atroviride IMI 206040]UKZ70130.1 hypothetical protein TrAtP1_011128 [Trichoderma atroviride]